MESSPHKPAIVIVDDEVGVLKALTMILRSFGFQVNEFNDPVAALSYIKTVATCDLVITDLRMPEIDGIELISQSKSLVPTRPCILVSGHAGEEEIRKARDIGVDGFLAKPFSPLELRDLIEKVLQKDP